MTMPSERESAPEPVLDFCATAPLGLELLLADELSELGAESVRAGRAVVRFRGPQRLGYRACLWSRLANRILWPLKSFPAATVEALYQGVRAIDWGRYLDSGTLFAVDFASHHSSIRHTLFGAQKVKDAIVDHFTEQGLPRPSVDLKDPDLRIQVYLDRDQATLSLDFSGESLHRRGYRLDGGQAPLKENLAAALLIRAGWPQWAAQGGGLLDPLCGSGTLPIEAAWMAMDRAPGLGRRWFGFMALPDYDAEAFAALLEEARMRAVSGETRCPWLRGTDQDPRAIAHARANRDRAGLETVIRFEVGDLESAQPGPVPTMVITNPPYGERLGDIESLEGLYRSLGSVLKTGFVGQKASVFTAQPELAFKLGIRATRQYAFYNGALPAKLFHFDIQPESFFEPRPDGFVENRDPALRQWQQRVRAVNLEEGSAQMVLNRLIKNIRHLGRWARQQQISCYRLYDQDLPDYAMALDLYTGEGQTLAHLQEYAPPASIPPQDAERRRIEFAAATASALALPLEAIIVKQRRRQRGREQYEKLQERGRFLRIEEGGLKFRVNLEDYLDTGLFLDHRETRELIRSMAPGARFLNLFAYTGSASVYAAAGGAKSTLSIDLSATYLEWAEANLALNGFQGPQHRFLKADCLAWLDSADETAERYDLIFLDPPTFSTSKRMQGTLDVQRDHVALIRACLKRLARGGRLIFTTNQRKFRLDQEALSDLRAQDISRSTLPKDFERNPRIHVGWIFEAEAR